MGIQRYVSGSNGHLVFHCSFSLNWRLPSGSILSSNISAMKYLCSPIAKVVQMVKEKAQVKFQQKLEFEASREVACSLP